LRSKEGKVRVKRCHRPLVFQLVPARIGAFGSKIGSRANPRFSGAIGKGHGPPFKAVSSPNGGAVTLDR